MECYTNSNWLTDWPHTDCHRCWDEDHTQTVIDVEMRTELYNTSTAQLTAAYSLLKTMRSTHRCFVVRHVYSDSVLPLHQSHIFTTDNYVNRAWVICLKNLNNIGSSPNYLLYDTQVVTWLNTLLLYQSSYKYTILWCIRKTPQFDIAFETTPIYSLTHSISWTISL